MTLDPYPYEGLPGVYLVLFCHIRATLLGLFDIKYFCPWNRFHNFCIFSVVCCLYAEAVLRVVVTVWYFYPDGKSFSCTWMLVWMLAWLVVLKQTIFVLLRSTFENGTSIHETIVPTVEFPTGRGNHIWSSIPVIFFSIKGIMTGELTIKLLWQSVYWKLFQ